MSNNMQSREELARKAIISIRNEFMAGLENGVTDGNISKSELPTREEMERSIYLDLTYKPGTKGVFHVYVDSDIKFLGEDRIKQIITERVQAYLEKQDYDEVWKEAWAAK